MTSTTAPASPLLVDRVEAARLLGVSGGTITNLSKSGRLPSVKLGARRLYDVADLRELIASAKRTAAAELRDLTGQYQATCREGGAA